MDNAKEKKIFLWNFLKIFVMGVIIGIVIPIASTIIEWQMENDQRKQLEIEQQQAELEQEQWENELAPTMKGEQTGTILLGEYEYTKYDFYNSENNIAGGRLKDINGIVMVECGEIRVKTLWVENAVYKQEIAFDGDRQRTTILLKEQNGIETKARNLRSEIDERLREQGVEGDCEFDVRLGMVVTLEYSDSNNKKEDKQYIIYLEEAPYCEAVEDGTVHCDQYYYLEYGKEEQGKEYEAVIEEAAERIRQECKGN